MVRRFVEQQHVGLREQQRAQRDAHLPAARKAVERAVLHLLVEAEAGEDDRRARGGTVRVDREQPFVHIAQPVGIGAGLGLCEQGGALDIGGEHGVERGGIAMRRFLRDIAQPREPRHLDLAVIGLELADHHLHQRRLARAVAPDQADAAARRDRRRRAVQDGAAAQAHGDIVHRKHGRSAYQQTRLSPSGPMLRRSEKACARMNGLRDPIHFATLLPRARQICATMPG
ncbi:MAG: hypothetical protein Q27BB25_15870 [Blastomonas sp. CACIA14H2]|nr:MAG: hypothetical protein Q27BB25_15870 [Blastomonas sp. CACIA14H2]